MIDDNYNLTASTKRLAPGAGIQEADQTNVAVLPCCLQPLDESFTQDIEGNFGKDFLMFCGIADVKENDKVVIDGQEYKVVGVEKLEHPAGNDHMEVRVRLFTA